MNILYKQPENTGNCSLESFGVHSCYLKRIIYTHDKSKITKKRHHHDGFELHIVTEGYREYKINEITYRINKGEFILIYPKILHTVISTSADHQEISLTFKKEAYTADDCFLGTLSRRMWENITFISEEAILKKEISKLLIENSILELLVHTFRLSGEKEINAAIKHENNDVVSLAKQYIDDNIQYNLSVTDVCEYCHISTKQLTRIFQKSEGVPPKKYIINKRMEQIEKLLSRAVSIKKISDIMNFNNEYYFNVFFKKYYGMPPGEYRKMIGVNSIND